MCYHLKREISSKWRSLKVPKVEKTSFVSWSTCSVQSARSTQVITFTTNGASHSDKMFQHYLITKLHYCSTTYWVKQFTCSVQRLSQMRKIYEYASKTAQSTEEAPPWIIVKDCRKFGTSAALFPLFPKFSRRKSTKPKENHPLWWIGTLKVVLGSSAEASEISLSQNTMCKNSCIHCSFMFYFWYYFSFFLC